MLQFKKFTQILNEGGAGGHMLHPFEVPTVRSEEHTSELQSH